MESIMVVRTTGAEALAAIMRAEHPRRAAWLDDFAWLLHGPTDPEVVETAEPSPWPLAAE
jgi:hypothetical protein